MNEIKKLKPFQRFCVTIGNLPSSYVESMSYEEQLLWFCNFLQNQVIPTVNNNAQAVIELQNYIQNYFSNLDVQEEINNKLDEMAESGELTDIIAQYLQLAGVLAFNTVNDLKNATNIVNGSTCRTLGNTLYNDGKGAYYKIRTITSSDVVDEENILSLEISNTLIAEKIIENNIKVFNTVNDMKNDNSLIVGMKVTTLGYYNINDKGNGNYYITNEELVNNNITIIELNNGLFAKLIYDKYINVIDEELISMDLLEELLNDNVMIYTNNPINITRRITISNNNIKINNMKFTCDDNTRNIFILYLNANNITVENCEFSGNCGNYIRLVNTENCNILKCKFDCNNGILNTSVVVKDSKNTTIDNNKFINQCGFNIQTLFSDSVNITNNIFKNSYIKEIYTANGGENYIIISVPYEPSRKGVRINNNIISNVNYEFNESEKTLKITFPNSLNNEDIVVFRGYRSLEPLNINGNTYNVKISSNSIDGSGDSGIVCCSDYHNGILDPSNVTEHDFPRRITISNNTVTNCAYGGIALTHRCRETSIMGNIVSNCGFLSDDHFSSGIVCAYAYPLTIIGNSISNVDTNESLYTEENGITKYGITIIPESNITSNNSYEYFKMNHKINIKNNIFNKLEKTINLYPTGNLHVQTGLNIDSKNNIIFDECNGITSSSGIYSLAGNNATIALDTSDTMDNNNSMKITFNNSSAYFVMNNEAITKIKDSLVKISFFAKASDNSKSARIYYTSDSGSPANSLQQPLDTEWKYYEMSVLIGKIPTSFNFRFSTSSNSGTVNVAHIRYSIQSINDSGE